MIYYFFFFNDTATTEIYTLSLHDALPISHGWSASRPTCAGGSPPSTRSLSHRRARGRLRCSRRSRYARCRQHRRSEEHTSELQSRQYLVCRLLLEKKKKTTLYTTCSCVNR